MWHAKGLPSVYSKNMGGKPMTDHEKQIGILWYKANNECLRNISDRWNQTDSVIDESIWRVTQAILSKKG